MKIALIALVSLFASHSAHALALHLVSCSNSSYHFQVDSIIGINPKAKALIQGIYSKNGRELATVDLEEKYTPKNSQYPYQLVYASKDQTADVKYTLYVGKATRTDQGDYVSTLVIESAETEINHTLTCHFRYKPQL